MTAPGDPRPPAADRDRHGTSVGRRQRQTGVGSANATMWAGALRRSVLWALAGAVIGLALGFVPWGDIPLALRLVAFGVGGFLGGAAAGFVYGAGRERDLDVEARRETRAEVIHDDHGVGHRHGDQV
jgi:hypothetical protein